MKLLCRLIMSLLISFPFSVWSDSPTHIMSLSIQPAPLLTSFIFTLSNKTPPTITTARNPDRVIVEFSHSDKHFNMNNAHIGGSNVLTINSPSSVEGTVRFEFITNTKPTYKSYFLPQDPTHPFYQYQLQIQTTH